MTRDEAIEIRRRQLCGEEIAPAMLAELSGAANLAPIS